jgi:hypothetical protein
MIKFKSRYVHGVLFTFRKPEKYGIKLAKAVNHIIFSYVVLVLWWLICFEISVTSSPENGKT